jgi:hypothetical protein
MCADVHKAEKQTSGCDDHCSTGAVQASRLGWGSWSRSRSSWSWSVSSWWRSVAQRAAEAAKKAAEAKKKAKCMETCKSLKCGLPQCKKAPEHRTCPPDYPSGDWCRTGFDLYAGDPWRNRWRHVGITGVDESRKYFKCLGKYCNPPIGAEYYFPARRTNRCTEEVVLERTVTSGRGFGMKSHLIVAVGSDYLSECGKCTD